MAGLQYGKGKKLEEGEVVVLGMNLVILVPLTALLTMLFWNQVSANMYGLNN
jgi:hypothetical protein